MSKASEVVLRLVAEGKITVEEAEELLDAIEGGAKEPFDGFFRGAGSGKARERHEEARGRARQARERAAEAKERAKRAARSRRGGYGGGFEFNFPWDDPDWQWPWEQEGWQWPWEQGGWQWGGAEESKSAVEVPAGAQLRINVTGGDLAIKGNGETASLNIFAPEASSQVSTENGAIHISSAGGDVMIEVPENVASMEIAHSGGDATIAELETDIIAKVSGGDMVISEFTGKLQASVEGGDATLRQINSTSVEVRTEGGDTDLSMLSPVEEGSILLSSSDDISLQLPSESQCEISAAAGGDIEHSLPPEALEIIEESDNYLNAKLNGGGAEITLSANTGDVSISTTP